MRSQERPVYSYSRDNKRLIYARDNHRMQARRYDGSSTPVFANMDNELLQRLRPLAEAYLTKRGASLVKALAAGGSAAVYVATDRARTFALKVYAPELLQGGNGAAERKRIELQ